MREEVLERGIIDIIKDVFCKKKINGGVVGKTVR